MLPRFLLFVSILYTAHHRADMILIVLIALSPFDPAAGTPPQPERNHGIGKTAQWCVLFPVQSDIADARSLPTPISLLRPRTPPLTIPLCFDFHRAIIAMQSSSATGPRRPSTPTKSSRASSSSRTSSTATSSTRSCSPRKSARASTTASRPPRSTRSRRRRPRTWRPSTRTGARWPRGWPSPRCTRRPTSRSTTRARSCTAT